MTDLMARLMVEEHLRRAEQAKLARELRPPLRRRVASRLVAVAQWLYPEALPEPPRVSSRHA
jgi:hypothetical protein